MSSDAMQVRVAAPTCRAVADAKDLPQGCKWTDVGVIPRAWEVVRLDQMARRGSGHTPAKSHPEYWGGAIQWISLKDTDQLDRRFIDKTAATITPLGLANSSAVLHPSGTVVLLRDAGIGKSAIMSTPMAVSQHFMAWQCGPRLHNVFLYYWLQFIKPELERVGMGNTIKTIGLRYFLNMEVPLPSLLEQRAIAEALSDVDGLLGALEALIAKKRGIKQAAMQQLFMGRTRLPGFSGGWESKRLGDVLSVCHGRSQREVEVSGGPYPILATGGQIGTASRPLYDKPSVLIGRKGTIDQPQYMDTPFWSVDTLFFCAMSADYVAKYFFYQFCLINWKLLNEASGVPSLNARTIEHIEVAVPDPAEQDAIATVLSDMDAEIAAIEARRDKTRAIKQGMMQQLLTGRVRLVNPQGRDHA